MDFPIDPAELHQFPDRLFRPELQVPANLRELIEDLDAELAARLDFDRAQLWQREHMFDDWRHFERDLPFLIPYRDDSKQYLLLCLLLEHQSQPDRLMPLAERTSEELLAAPRPWLNVLAVVRATQEESSRFRSVFAATVERLAGLANRERMRWRELMWMLISWALRRRPHQERPGLIEVALEYQPDLNSQKEVQTMSTTLGQTLEEWAEQRGIEQGELACFPTVALPTLGEAVRIVRRRTPAADRPDGRHRPAGAGHRGLSGPAVVGRIGTVKRCQETTSRYRPLPTREKAG